MLKNKINEITFWWLRGEYISGNNSLIETTGKQFNVPNRKQEQGKQWLESRKNERIRGSEVCCLKKHYIFNCINDIYNVENPDHANKQKRRK